MTLGFWFEYIGLILTDMEKAAGEPDLVGFKADVGPRSEV